MANVRPAESTVDPRGGGTPSFDVPYSSEGEGGSLANSIQQAGSSFARAGDEVMQGIMHAKHLGDATQVTGMVGQGNQLLNDLVLDPKNGFSSKKGDAAMSSYDDAVKAVKEGIANIGKGAANPDQAKAWGIHADSLEKRALLLINSHTSQQRDIVATDRFNTATTAITNQLALLDPLDPNTAGPRLQGMASLRQLALARAQTMGIGGTYQAADGSTRSGAEDFAAKYLQQGAQTIMDRTLATENGAVAKAAFQQLQPYLGHLASHYAKPVQEAGDRQIADGLAIKLDRSTTSVMGKPNPDAAQAQLDHLFTAGKITPQVYEHAQGRLALRMNEKSNAWNKSVDQGFQQAYATALSKDPQTGLPMVDLNRVPTGSPTTPGTQQWLQAVAPEKYDHLKLMTLRDTRTEDKENAPAARAARLNAYYQLATNPEKFASMTPAAFTSEFASRLAPKDFDSFGKVWTDHLAANAKETPGLPPAVLKTVLDVGRQAGVFPSGNRPPDKWSSTQKALYDQLNNKLIQEAQQFKQQNGRPPKNEELQNMAVNHLVTVDAPGAGFFGGSAPRSLLQQELVNGDAASNYAVLKVPGVPDEQVQGIVKTLKDAGQRVTGSNVLTVYKRQQARKAAGQ